MNEKDQKIAKTLLECEVRTYFQYLCDVNTRRAADVSPLIV